MCARAGDRMITASPALAIAKLMLQELLQHGGRGWAVPIGHKDFSVR